LSVLSNVCGALSPLEDRSSVGLIIAAKPPNTRQFQTFFSVEMAARLWKCSPEYTFKQSLRLFVNCLDDREQLLARLGDEGCRCLRSSSALSRVIQPDFSMRSDETYRARPLPCVQRSRSCKDPPPQLPAEACFGLTPFEDRGSGHHFAILSRHQPAALTVATHPYGGRRRQYCDLCFCVKLLRARSPHSQADASWMTQATPVTGNSGR
jgi:hypothetical protein